jgi:hypothetical protein
MVREICDITTSLQSPMIFDDLFCFLFCFCFCFCFVCSCVCLIPWSTPRTELHLPYDSLGFAARGLELVGDSNDPALHALHVDLLMAKAAANIQLDCLSQSLIDIERAIAVANNKG